MENFSLPAVKPVIDQTIYDTIVNRIFVIEDVTLGKGGNDYLVRYHGHLRTEDSISAYDQLSASLESYNITPLFRKEADRQTILLMAGVIRPKPSNPWINLLMFVLTVISVAFVGGISSPSAATPPSDPIGAALAVLADGLPFALALMAILVAHEFGHYLVGRWHGVHVSLPYFIPLPIPPFGTMGAFINMKERPKNRRYLLDIGIAGPIAGVIIAIPVILLGLSLSNVGPLPLRMPSGMAMTLEGNSLLYLLLKYITFGKLLPAPATYGSLPPIIYWLQFFFTGRPFPWGGVDVNISPVAFAGWGGLLVTSLNLIPAGQFDGGHVMFVLFGRKAMQRMLPFILVALVVLGFFWPGWWLWVALIFFLGRAYAEPLDQITELDPKRRALAIFAVILLILVFTPVPLNIFR